VFRNVAYRLVEELLGLELALICYSNPAQPVVRGRRARRYLKWENISNQFPGKADVERQRNCENFWAVCLWRYTLRYWLILYKCAKTSDTLACVVNCIFYNIFLVSR
jgi:hypothetical protein